ncbi:DNA polymerase I, 5' --_ 3' polymerase, 5' --_ 3' and 3' --_ 5' exonuclease [Campylobacter pinnipediorum subsp. caledonicus]|uniref:DNA polymerase I n=1 Tax=Campylobacter pinnipediorum subsp. caledonicus TaxID=1874362 RepID=A0A1S6U6N5_9BACT|nr:DNA polymerase I [Campylobacter pinnipediorum]AQW85797.1 DNA polymerase I, 5' --> 3' polymerase, 5' --> 3' and 3' --> 5' exonuclease [Campylobacter pinnipediorum subsp. caledonicus]AQW87408.1 DNA polymerase I, 5' --> 3' polymerase, 5' --> 3' and 3' --> 5' exonuclease [Campylobacter pinnipediorum subsp. caledonicus]
MSKKILTIIDTFGFFFRLYYAMPHLKNKQGNSSGMISGFANFINNLKDEFESDYIIFALDSKGKTLRHDIDNDYKANRSEPPKELKEQLPICIKMIEDMGLCAINKDGYEADDIIASVVKIAKSKDIFVRVVTHDKDLYQLIDDGKVSIYSPITKIEHDSNSCLEKYGVRPEKILDFLALIGDTSDNIPGVKGIGTKGAKKLLDEFKDIEDIYNNLSLVLNERTKNMLIDGKDSAFLSKKLATLFDDALVDLPLDDAIFPTENPLLNIVDTLYEYDLNKIIKNLKMQDTKDVLDLKFNPILITDEEKLQEILSTITSETIVAFDTETTSVDVSVAKLVGFSFCFNEDESYYVPVAHSYLGVGKQINIDFCSWAISQIYSGCVIGHNLKYDFAVVKNNLDINPPKNYKDTMILAWLSEPAMAVGMDALAKRLYNNYETLKFESIVKKNETFADVDLQTACKYASEDAWITLKFYKSFLNLLEPNLLELADKLEFEFIKVLLDMENEGIKLDVQKLRELIISNDTKLKELTSEIYTLCGENFNINSVQQLGTILFDKLSLPAKKKTKTGYSTDESVLNDLIDSHEVIPKILSYRELYKLQNTYCEPLLNLALKDKNSRIYTSFLQTGTSTGRLSSKNPNLQNIPARGHLAKDVRSAFVAKDGFSFIGLDYSQIELRLLAHFSQDEALVKAFLDDEDIHTRTAISIFGEFDDQKRSVAKSINFGLIYGMGASKLSNQINISRAQAKEYISLYFKAFPTIKEFLEGIKIKAREDGFIATLLGRKRYFDFTNATPMQLAMYEREAVNTKFQGSAADIIKMSMVEIAKITDENAKLLLQIHDELIFEVKDEYAQEFGKKAQNIMQNITKLNVPLKTSLNYAKDWAGLK